MHRAVTALKPTLECQDVLKQSTLSPTCRPVAMYAGNAEEHGSYSLLLAHQGKYVAVLKHCRQASKHQQLEAQLTGLTTLLEQDRFDAVRPRIVSGRNVRFQNESFIYFPFLDGPNGFMAMRTDWLGRKGSQCVDTALEFCFDLHQASQSTLSWNAIWQETKKLFCDAYSSDLCNDVWRSYMPLKQNMPDCSITLVHNDLSPDNIMHTGKEWRVLDWEYWSHSLSVFNFLDVVFNFGSVLSSPRIARRSPNDYWTLFYTTRTRNCRRLLGSLRYFALESQCGKYDAAAAEWLCRAYLMNKACCQYRVYGRHYRFDLFWQNLLVTFDKHRVAFRSFWQTLFK